MIQRQEDRSMFYHCIEIIPEKNCPRKEAVSIRNFLQAPVACMRQADLIIYHWHIQEANGGFTTAAGRRESRSGRVLD